jgi:hypothetical protein
MVFTDKWNIYRAQENYKLQTTNYKLAAIFARFNLQLL